MSNKHGAAISSFSEWKQAVSSAIDEKVSCILTKLTKENSRNTLRPRDQVFTEQLLHNKFFVAAIDKDSIIVAFFCQRHYAQVLINDLGVNNVKSIPPAFMKAIKPVEKILSDTALFLKSKFNLAVNEINKKFPNI